MKWIALASLLLTSLGFAQEENPPRLLSACEAAGEWEGGTVDADVKRGGEASIRWAHADSDRLGLVDAPADWTSHDTIRFQLHSEVKTDSEFMLIIVSENPGTEGMDYWMARLKLDFEGWKEIVLPRRSMNRARRPKGWDQVGEVFFTASGWENEPDPRAVVHIDQFELYDRVGPLLTDEALFEAIDLTLPELEATRAAVEAGDLAKAQAELATYLRERTSVPWWFDPHNIDRGIRHNRDAADKTVQGEIRQIAIWHTFPDGEIDWFYNPTLERDDIPGNHEWQWQLGRMGYWGGLGTTYWATGEDIYGETFVKHLRSWVKGCPRPENSGNTAGSAWRTIECGIRMGGSWPTAYHRFLHSPTFTDEDVCLYVKSCIEHAQHLRQHPTGGNWLTMEMSGLYTVGAVFPELKEAEAWRTYAIGRMHDELNKQFYPDGAQIELTPGYHQVALGNILKVPRTATLVGREDELPDDYTARMEKAYDYNLRLMTPDRSLPRFNDSWGVGVPGTLATAAGLFPERQDFRWVATDGKEGTPPEGTSHALDWAGYYAMRSGWERDANYLAFDAGPLGSGHLHQDKLNVVIWSHGREVLFDGGGGSYESSPWRAYGTGAASHNIINVDGKHQKRGSDQRLSTEPVDARWESTEGYDFAAGLCEGGFGNEAHKPATHSRRVLFAKPDLFVVVDTLTPTDGAEHTYQARWHLLPTETEVAESTLAVVTQAADQPNLVVVPLLAGGLRQSVVSAQKEPELLGWWVNKDSDPQYIPATTITQGRRGAGVQHFLTLFIALAAGEGDPVEAITPTGEVSAEVTLTDGRKLRIEADPDGNGGVSITETLADGADGRSVGAGYTQ